MVADFHLCISLLSKPLCSFSSPFGHITTRPSLLRHALPAPQSSKPSSLCSWHLPIPSSSFRYGTLPVLRGSLGGLPFLCLLHRTDGRTSVAGLLFYFLLLPGFPVQWKTSGSMGPQLWEQKVGLRFSALIFVLVLAPCVEMDLEGLVGTSLDWLAGGATGSEIKEWHWGHLHGIPP